MRLLTGLALLGLLASIPLALGVHRERPPDRAVGEFVEPDPHRRAALGEEKDWLGVILSGYEEAAARDPADLGSLRGRIRAGIVLGAVAVDQPHISELVAVQTSSYLERRAELDPDGSFLQRLAQDWVTERLRFPLDTRMGFYARTATAIFLAARGDPRGTEALWEVTRMGEFFIEFFPYVRRFHPGWDAVAPLIEHYLEEGSLAARIEAGTTLIDYHLLYGVGSDLMERFLPRIRSAYGSILRELRAGNFSGMNLAAGENAIIGIGMLANAGYEEEVANLRRMELRHYPQQADVIKMAKVWGGLWTFQRYSPTTQNYEALTASAREHFFGAAAHRLARLRRQAAADGTDVGKERDEALQMLQTGFDSPVTSTRVRCLHALAVHGDEAGREALRRALSERSVLSIFAAVLADDLDDRVPYLLPALMSGELDFPALAAASLLDLGPKRALQK